MSVEEGGKKQRRAAGEGSLVALPDGRWRATWEYPRGADGRRRRRKQIAPTRTSAARALEALRKDAEKTASLNREAERWSVADWLNRWIEDEAATSVRPRTLELYRGHVQKHIVPAIGGIALRKLTPSHVKTFHQSELEPRVRVPGRPPRAYSAQTVRNVHATLRRALEVGVRYGYVERNVARLVSPPAMKRGEITPLDREEIAKLLETAHGHELEPLIVLLASTGMRLGEALGLTWPCVDLDGGNVRVERALSRYGRAYHLGEPKTRQSRRTIPIAPPVAGLLRHHRDRALLVERRGRDDGEWVGNEWGLVFTDALGAPLGARTVRDRFNGLLDAAGVRHIRIHDLRHGAATFCLWRACR